MKISTFVQLFAVLFLWLILLFDFLALRGDNVFLACALVLYLFVSKFFIRTRRVDNANRRSFIVFFTIMALFYVGILYFFGLFAGLYRNTRATERMELVTILLPYLVIIVAEELIRKMFLTRENRICEVLATAALILTEGLMAANRYNFMTFAVVLDYFCMVFLPAVSANILKNYVVKRFDCIGNILYTAVTTLYLFSAPLLPNLYPLFHGLYRLFFPLLVFYLIRSTYRPNEINRRVEKNSRTGFVIPMFVILSGVSFLMLISCKFHYGIMTIGSGSMTGSINKGDAVFFERYGNQKLQIGDVIIFNSDDRKVVHRIIGIDRDEEGEKLYKTKGDANNSPDSGYRRNRDVYAVVSFRIMYIGWPTIWINEMFAKRVQV